MTADKDIGRLEGKMDMLIGKVNSIESKVDRITSEGCMRRETHEESIRDVCKRVENLEGLLKKALLIGLVSAGGGAGLIKAIESIMQ
jgi:hypothetical protein